MKNWDRIGKVKAIIIGIAVLVNLFMPFKPIEEIDFMFTILWPLISVITLFVVVRIINAKFFKRRLNKSVWNDNPLYDSNAMAEFFAYFLIAIGISMIVGAGIKFQSFNNIGATVAVVGLGILIGNFLIFKIFSKKKYKY